MVDSIDDNENCPENYSESPKNCPERPETCPKMSQEHCPNSASAENIVNPDGFSMKKKLTIGVTFVTVILCSLIGLSVGLGIDGEIKGEN